MHAPPVRVEPRKTAPPPGQETASPKAPPPLEPPSSAQQDAAPAAQQEDLSNRSREGISSQIGPDQHHDEEEVALSPRTGDHSPADGNGKVEAGSGREPGPLPASLRASAEIVPERSPSDSSRSGVDSSSSRSGASEKPGSSLPLGKNVVGVTVITHNFNSRDSPLMPLLEKIALLAFPDEFRVQISLDSREMGELARYLHEFYSKDPEEKKLFFHPDSRAGPQHRGRVSVFDDVGGAPDINMLSFYSVVGPDNSFSVPVVFLWVRQVWRCSGRYSRT